MKGKARPAGHRPSGPDVASPGFRCHNGVMIRHALRSGLAAALLLAALTLAVFWPVTRHAFLTYDDDAYLTANPQVRDGLSWSGVRWALTATHAANWHPLTWMSHMADVTLFGMRPGLHHLMGLLLHAAAAVLLFLALRGMSGSQGASAFTAALFAVHPLHVESVAWAAERKDVLSGLLWMLTLLGYLRYVRKPALARGLLVAGMYALLLMAKPMGVTLPFLLLLLDRWPLGRWGRWGSGAGPGNGAGRGSLPALVLEKLPLFILAGASAAVTYVVQARGGALGPPGFIPLGPRLANALVSGAWYLAKTFWPTRLSFFYPHPGALIAPYPVALGGVVLAGVTLLVLLQGRRRPFLSTGWFWYLGTLVPVSGLVQAGPQARADRYTYLPLVGIFLLIAWGIPSLLGGRRRALAAVAVAGVLAVGLLGAASRVQAGYWRDSETLFRRALAVTADNWLAHNALGAVLAADNRLDEAREHFREAVRLAPQFWKSHYNYGLALAAAGRYDEAVVQYQEVLRFQHGSAEVHRALGQALEQQGKLPGALEYYLAGLQTAPADAGLLYAAGWALHRLGRLIEAETYLRAAVARRPDYPEALNSLGITLVGLGRPGEAKTLTLEALRLKPDLAEARVSLGNLLLAEGKAGEAAERYREAIRLNPRLATAHNNLGVVLLRSGETASALLEYRAALDLDPGYAEARDNLDNLLARLGGRRP